MAHVINRFQGTDTPLSSCHEWFKAMYISSKKPDSAANPSVLPTNGLKINSIVSNIAKEDAISSKKPDSSANPSVLPTNGLKINSIVSNIAKEDAMEKVRTAIGKLSAAAKDLGKPEENDAQAQPPEKRSSESRFRHVITSERFAQLRKHVDESIKNRKTFTVIGGWQRIRNALLRRGWVEKHENPANKKPPPQNQAPAVQASQSQTMEDMCSNLPTKKDWESLAAYTTKCERTITSRMLQNHGVDFYWNMKREPNNFAHRANTNQVMNKFGRSLFTSKEGLNLLLQQVLLKFAEELHLIKHKLWTGFPDHYNHFIEDFRLTACISMLKWYKKNYAKGESSIKCYKGTIPHTAVTFAVDRCNDYVAVQKHADIDKDMNKVWNHEWDLFLSHFYLIVYEHQLLQESKEWQPGKINASVIVSLTEIAKVWPMIDIDGDKNIWILKPGNKCRGRGIQLIKNIKDVAKVMELKLKYVVQKYIERPLLVYHTKFDIRQWFMVTSSQPLCIWMYRDSYLRFSSQIFDLDNFHESLHLTNHAVQCKYANVSQRDKALPEDNMWDCHMFKNYLKLIGHGDKWDCVIFPGMRENIIGTMLACQDTMDRRPNTYELYGADFILGEDFKPWLLEINSSPDLSSSTSVTAKMCPQVLEDLIKVTVDKRRNPDADTGSFIMIYKQNLPRPPAYLGMSLTVRGRRLFKLKKNKNNKEEKEYENLQIQRRDVTKMDFLVADMTAKCMPSVPTAGLYHGPVIKDLIEDIQNTVVRPPSVGYEFARPVTLPSSSKNKRTNQRVSQPPTNLQKTQNSNSCFGSRKGKNDNIKKSERFSNHRVLTVKSANFSFVNEWKSKSKFETDQDIYGSNENRKSLRPKHYSPKFNSELSKLLLVNKNNIHLIRSIPLNSTNNKQRLSRT